MAYELTDALNLYEGAGIYPFHMPGHKSDTFITGRAWFGQDITEIDGFGDLNGGDRSGLLFDAQERAAAFYGSKKAFYLLGGSTLGILAGIHTLSLGRSKSILMPRGSHRSVYNAACLFGLKPVYLSQAVDPHYGIYGGVSPESVKAALDQNPDIGVAVITSPTYEGVVSDIPAIAELLHKKGIPLLVDGAHGAHFGFSDFFPKSAVGQGADLVVQSLHKTLPAPTQTALLHVCGDTDAEEVARSVSIFQTSSPSYVLMAAMDDCICVLQKEGEKLFADYERRLKSFYAEARELKKLHVLPCDFGEFFGRDPGKLVISARGTSMSGTELKNILLDEHRLMLEMAGADYALAMTSVCDTDEGFSRLSDALKKIDASPALLSAPERVPFPAPGIPEYVLPAGEALFVSGRTAAFSECAGEVCREYIWAYPPGIPLIVPGERISGGLLEYMRALLSRGIDLKSTRGSLPGHIEVVA